MRGERFTSWTVPALLLLLVTSPVLAATGKPSPFAGNDTCTACHDTQQPRLGHSAHWSAFQLKLPSAAARGCESCHGPGRRHAEDPSEPIQNFQSGTPAQRDANCLACHPGQWQSLHRRAGLACADCHVSGHGERTFPGLLRAPQVELCGECHSEQKRASRLPFRHRTSSRAIRCSDCHDPHDSFRAAANLDLGESRCLECHSEQEGPFTFEHLSSTITGCTSCHQPHGATNPKLLVRTEVRSLCLECHGDTPAFHDQSVGRFQKCTLCHSAIHGSYVDPHFLR